MTVTFPLSVQITSRTSPHQPEKREQSRENLKTKQLEQGAGAILHRDGNEMLKIFFSVAHVYYYLLIHPSHFITTFQAQWCMKIGRWMRMQHAQFKKKEKKRKNGQSNGR